jgi:DNA-binding NarL/FixJ family response regulator
LAAHATGTVLLDEGDAAAALQALRAAAAAWRSLRLPYEAARTRVLIGAACAALDDPNGAELEWADAEATLAELGARPDLERLRASTKPRRPGRDPLSAREHEVLVLLAEGRTNREIADALTVSTSTAGRHVEHIFTKLGVTSRAAATAYAYEHGLL